MQDQQSKTAAKMDKRAAALRDNLRKRKALAKDKKDKEKASKDDSA